jgi:DNA replication protein DnaC
MKELERLEIVRRFHGGASFRAIARAVGVDRKTVAAVVARRRERGIKRRITAAHFAEHKTLEIFDWRFNKTIARAQYKQLATGDFIRRHTNVVLVGQSGVGKSHLMQAVGLSVCALGYRVYFTTSTEPASSTIC